MMRAILGLDIGGANLKAAHSSGVARTSAFPLWKHPDRLSEPLQHLCTHMPAFDVLAVTMTGELCDCFATKREGVRAILQAVRAAAPMAAIRVWTIGHRFVSYEQALDDPVPAAAANWLAQAHLAAGMFRAEHALMIDVGSTTTDLVYLDRGDPRPRAYTDRERLATGELVYTGLRRTPICAVLGMEVAAEFFATMLDAYIMLEYLSQNSSDCDTADGRPVTRANAHARLARMCCADVESFSAEDARQLAIRAVAAQGHAIGRAIQRVLSGRAPIQRVLLSGSGEVVLRAAWAASALAAPAVSLAELLGPALSEAACAYAVAKLALRESA